ncbi:bifunctional glycosyltransferase/CDP-glycerol:glycerophosphate glycerophosphotransferase [Streptomyces harbinensis]
MPRFSVIMTVHRAPAEHLHAALTSVLGQRFAGLELIAVDDPADSEADAVLRGYAAADRRLVRLRLPCPVGPGAARNAGLDRARGAYVLFLDAADTLAPGALPAIDARLRATGDPQLLLFRDTATDPGTGLYSEQPPEVMTLADRPGLLWLDPAVHARAHRRDLIDRLGLRFPPGHYADLPFSQRALTAAGSIAVLDRSCVRRAPSPAPAHRPTGRAHLDLLRQYDRLFAQPLPARWRAPLYQRMLADLTRLHQRPGLLPPAARAEFFRHAAALGARHRATSGATPLTDGRHRARPAPARWLRAGAAFAARARLTTRRAAQALAPRLRTYGRWLRAAALRLYYRLHLHRPLLTDLAVFLPATGGYAGHPAALESRVRALAPHLRTVWIAGPEHARHLPEGPRRLHPHSPAAARALARARYLVSDAPFPAPVPDHPRADQHRLHTHRGTPIALPPTPPTPDDRQTGCWTTALSTGPHATRAARRAHPGPYTLLEYGSPQADRLLTAGAEDVRAARAALGVPDGVLTVLYVPAHRPYEPGPGIPHLDVAGLAARLGPGHLLLSRAPLGHPAPGVREVPAAGHPDLMTLCLAADVLLTDYHPVIFEYVLLDRPIVVHAADWADYRTARGVCLELPDCPPGPVTRTEDELHALFTDPAAGLWDAHGARLRAAFRAAFSPRDDGRAAERVVREVFLDGHGLPAVTPPGARRAHDPATDPVPAS